MTWLSHVPEYPWLSYRIGVAAGIIPLLLAVVGLILYPMMNTVNMGLSFIPVPAVTLYAAEGAVMGFCWLLNRLRPVGRGILTGLIISTAVWHMVYIWLPLFVRD